MNDSPVSLSVKGFLDDSIRYRVPMYQRNYAWSEGEITQLIQDIIDCLPDQKPYYIGTLVVCKKLENQKYIYETVDGQQRLTTISLLASFLKNENKGDFSWYKSLCIEFECRERSQKTFETIFNNRFQDDPTELLRYAEINTAILNGYRIIKRILPIKLNEKLISYKEFFESFTTWLKVSFKIRRSDFTF